VNRTPTFVFAGTLVVLGILGLMKGDFIGLWQPVPRELPARMWMAYLCAIIPLVSGAGLFWKRTVHGAAAALLAWMVLWLLAIRIPAVVQAPLAMDAWYGWAEVAVYASAAWVLYGKGLRLARTLYGLEMIPFGIGHFVYVNETAQLVPAWLPGHFPLAYITGVAYIAAGIAIVAGSRVARWAAILSTLQMGLFTLLVWLPTVIAGPSAFQWSEFVISVTLTAAGWVVADSYEERPRPPA